MSQQRVQGLTDTISKIQPVKNIVETYNKIFGVIDNQMLLLKCEFAGREWKEVHKNTLMTNFFLTKHHYYY